MTGRKRKGNAGEQLAGTFLQAQGFVIHESNWRHQYYEVDVIASRDGILHFVEVKTRHNQEFGHPEEAVSAKKLENLRKCAEVFLDLHPDWMRVQFDVVAITRLQGAPDEILFIEDVF